MADFDSLWKQIESDIPFNIVVKKVAILIPDEKNEGTIRWNIFVKRDGGFDFFQK